MCYLIAHCAPFKLRYSAPIDCIKARLTAKLPCKQPCALTFTLQTEKQRIIWAYKILFLDVLFPLGLRKVIFCDSDQVIRGDMAELWDMDLQVNSQC